MEQIIDTLTTSDIERGPFPIRNLLHHSLYYPSAGLDGGVVKDCNTTGRDDGIRSFIYCDYATGPEAYRAEENSFRGYHVLGSRALSRGDLAPQGWQPVWPPGLHPGQYMRYKQNWRPFANWTVYERDADHDETHGPQRFSLIYIGGEGVATYQGLYWTHRIVPAALAIIQPGTGFGLNWTDFRSSDAPLAWTVRNHPVGQPELIYYGGIGGGYTDFSWGGYAMQDRKIRPYYPDFMGEVTLWKKFHRH
jgi:hypothetical protein